jgi:S1-C subfamily serine protease
MPALCPPVPANRGAGAPDRHDSRFVTGLDWTILGFTALLAGLGFLRGFIVGALSLAGFAGGAFLGTRLAPALLSGGSASPYAPLFGLLGALIGGAVLAGGLEGIGLRLRALVRLPGFGIFDGVLGAALSAAVALGIVWVAGAVALQTPGARVLRKEIQRSAILQRLNDVLPPSGSVLNALARFDPFPDVAGPLADVPPPTEAIARDPEVRAAGASVVRVLGTACGLGVSGSGWVAGAGLVVTNAHVVAGQEDTTVQLGGEGPALDATAVAYDPTDDIAVLRVSGLDAPALRMASVERPGAEGAILGFPLDGPYDVRAARIGPTRTVTSQDAYGEGPVRRRMTALRGLVRPGNSGGPLVNGDGQVVGTIFAARTGSGPASGYAVPDREVRQALDRATAATAAVSTGPCAAG